MKQLGRLAASASAVLLLCSPAAANSSRIPLSFVQRPLALPDAVMRLDGGPRFWDYDAQIKHVVIDDGPDLLFLNPGFSFGITRNFDLGFVTPVRLAPDNRLEDPRFYVLYQLQDADFSYGLFGQVRMGFQDITTATFGVPMYVMLGSDVRLETGPFAEFVLEGDTNLNLMAPLYFSFQVSDRAYLGPEFGLALFGVFEDGTGVATPIGGFFGYTIGSAANPLGDLYGRVRLTDVPDGAIELMFGLEFFFDL